MSVEEVKTYYSELECWKHSYLRGWTWEDLEAEEGFVESVPDGDTGYAFCRLKDGRYVVFAESQDYSGHG